MDYTREIERYEKLRKKRGLTAIWSIPATAFTKQHPYKGATQVKYDAHWGEAKAVTVPIRGKTWLSLYRAASKAVELSGDTHHVFIEGFEAEDETLNLVTGS